jgi:hypothetical protein
MFVTMLWGMAFFIRCPNCHVPWGQFAVQSGPLSIDKRIRFCPFCGRDIDVEVVEEQGPTD